MNKNMVTAELKTKIEGGDCTLKLKHLSVDDAKFLLSICAKLDLLKKVKLDPFQTETIKAEMKGYNVDVEYTKPKKEKNN